MEKIVYEIKIDEIAKFLERPNRFICKAQLKNGEIITAHVHDSGRIKELLYPENTIFLRHAKDIKNRKTEWDLIGALAEDGEEILLNSSFHRYISENILKDCEISPFGKIDSLKAEVKNGHSRLDYLIEKNNIKIWIEVKGVSLSVNKRAIFPDAPSERASKHLNTLMEIKKNGERACILFLVFRNSDSFIPNLETDKLFFDTFYKALENGIEVYFIQLKLKNGKIFYTDKKIYIENKSNFYKK